MSSDEESTGDPPSSTGAAATHNVYSVEKARTAIASLSRILSSVPSSLSSSENPALSLLLDTSIAKQISALLRSPTAGAGDDNLCRWLYDTFQSGDSALQLIVLRFVPAVAGAYLPNAGAYLVGALLKRRSLAGFEAVLLALYAHETSARNGQAVTVNIPDLSHCSIYHETKLTVKNSSTDLNLAVLSPSLEPHGTVRSTRRARIVGVALELYYGKISQMPLGSKLDFCEFCRIWAGQDGEMYKNCLEEDEEVIRKKREEETRERDEKVTKSGDVEERESGKIQLPWELLQPALRILGHCIMGPMNKAVDGGDKLQKAACIACRALYARALHDVSPRAILATSSLLRLAKLAEEAQKDRFDPTDIPVTAVINV
ncbi:uncharacterized protein LOC124921220 [Impatiens glandulifera]|uniref:uncharacterized protein LOC124921220 n=1 Tax=Impatiens glandulifera TaxID=253017 RepID=UPI001FB099EF|nr:uncharacterized protein LOC124921220 [Impatiens glandulifera]